MENTKMMASLAEQRRFLKNIDTASTSELEMIAELIMILVVENNATPQDIKFHEQICLELFYRQKKA